MSTVGAAVLSAKATPKALELIQYEEYQRHEELTTAEKVKVAWKCYIPAGLLIFVSCASTVCGTKIGIARQAELISLVTAGENMFERYRRKVEEKFGKDAEQGVRTELAKDRVEQLRSSYSNCYDGLPKECARYVGPNDLVAYDTGLGNELIWDDWNGRFLRGSETEFLKAVAVFNKDTSFGIGTFFPVNNFYDLINAPTAKNGIDQGFDQNYMLDIEFRWDSDKHVYKIMTFVNNPKFEGLLTDWR